MKKSDVRELRDIVRTLCKELEETPWAIVRMETLMLGLIELARTKKPWVAVDVALTVQEELLKIADDGIDARREREQDRGSPVGIAWRPIGVERARVHADGYFQVHHDAPRPAATVEQMRAAADAAMAADPELVEWDCSVCHKKTLTDPDADEVMPIGWSTSTNLNTGEAVYTCNECRKFGIKVPKEERQYQCMGCDAETESRVFPPPGWKEVEDGEVICFACAEADAEVGDV